MITHICDYCKKPITEVVYTLRAYNAQYEYLESAFKSSVHDLHYKCILAFVKEYYCA